MNKLKGFIAMDRRKIKTKSFLSSLFQIACQTGILAIALCTVGCSKRYSDLPAYSPISFGEYDNESVGRFKTSFLADQIDTYYRGSNPGPIGVTTLVNLDDLYTTSSFGRVYAEQLISELAMRGYDVIELRHADALQFLSDRGEFALSREAGMVRRSRELSGVVVGTYVASPIRVYVNARLIDPSTSMVLSAGSVEMEKTKEIGKLLRVGGFPASLERIPVKHLTFGSVPDYGPRHENWKYDWEESQGPYAGNPHGSRDVQPQFHDKPVVSKPEAKHTVKAPAVVEPKADTAPSAEEAQGS